LKKKQKLRFKKKKKKTTTTTTGENYSNNDPHGSFLIPFQVWHSKCPIIILFSKIRFGSEKIIIYEFFLSINNRQVL